MKYTPVGVDIAKYLIQVHLINEHTGEVVDKQLRSKDFLAFFSNREPCLIGMEACGGSQHWARELEKLGHKVRLSELDSLIDDIEKQLISVARQSETCKRLMEIPGVGSLIAMAAAATMGETSAFKSGREFAAYVGLVPKQTGSGGKVRLLGISKRGDTYLRILFFHGERTAALLTKEPGPWITELKKRRPTSVAIVAIANKLARTVWAIGKRKPSAVCSQ
ncbi:hypothetical protein CSM81_23800 [Salmonella enterica subsp. enterica serovar Infantis]|nr:hypothetical protein [Salmonella enterica subsp. enterica serovar Infantis]